VSGGVCVWRGGKCGAEGVCLEGCVWSVCVCGGVNESDAKNFEVHSKCHQMSS
jgi:hypothetical protein